ncbi:hypothetical protein [Planctomicrobium piriforme]|nr:hypothetical protein [Planctomicrobium piriforme]
MFDESTFQVLIALNISIFAAVIAHAMGRWACVTGMLLLLSFGNLPISIASPWLPSSTALTALQGVPFGYTAVVAVLLTILSRPQSRLELHLRRWSYALLVLIAVYGAYGMVKNGSVASLIYLRMLASPFLMTMIGAWAALDVTRETMLKTIKINGLIAAALVLTEAFAPQAYLETINYPTFHSLKSGDDFFDAKSVIFARERRLFNMREFENVKFYKPAGPTFNYPSGSYICYMGVFASICLGNYISAIITFAALAALSTKSGLAMCVLSLAALLPFPPRAGPRWWMALTVCGLYVAGSFVYLSSGKDLHSYSLKSSIRQIPSNPLGQGLGYGGSSTVERKINWEDDMIIGESGVAIALNMMGLASVALYLYYFMMVRLAIRRNNPFVDRVGFAIGFIGLIVIGNSVLQELAVGPYGLGFIFLMLANSECAPAKAIAALVPRPAMPMYAGVMGPPPDWPLRDEPFPRPSEAERSHV